MRLWLQQLVVLASVVAVAVPASAKTGRDPRSCYVFSDTTSPVASDAPQPDLVPIAGLSTPLALDDDTPSAPIALPFVFEFFGKPYTSVSVSPNGFLRFGPPEALTANWPRGTKMPDARSPNGVLAGLWKDIDPSRGGTVVHAVVGSPPDRRFVVQFSDVPDRDRPAVLNSFQIELAETSNDIVVRYAGASGSGAFGGVEGENGAAGLNWFTDEDPLALERAAVRYSPLHLDTDGDGWSDCVDTCRLVSNITQLDSNLDGTGDACERSSPPVTVGSGALRDDTDRNIDSARPGVALDAAGNAIVVWDGPIDGDDRGIAGRWFDAAGAPLAGPFRVNAVLTQMQIAPRVATTPGGGFVVTWGRSDGVSKTSTVRLQRYESADVPQSGEQTLTSPASTFSTTQPAVAIDTAGAATVAWGARYENPRVRPVELQRFDASGQTVGPIVRAGEIGSGSAPALPDVVVEDDGDLTVAWRTDTGSVQLRRFDKNGVPFAAAPLVVALVDPTSPNRGPDLFATGKNTFLTWIGLLSEGSQVFVQRFYDGVQRWPAPLALETGAGAASNPAIAVTGPERPVPVTGPDGPETEPTRLLIVWEQGNRILGQTIAPDGRALERPFALSPSTDPTVVQAMPAIAGMPDGRAAVAWRESRVGVVSVLLRQFMRCGNGNIDPGEDCDDGNTVAGDCCSATCTFEKVGTSCDDGLFCTLDSTCSQGVCVADQPRDCNDGNVCTADRCDEPTASCVFHPGLLAGAA
jgi:cysteine-rich repeat protein